MNAGSINVWVVIRDHLLTNAALVALVGDRIYAGVDLPEGYTPADGPAILFNARGGTDEYHRVTTKPSVQYRCYAATPILCMTVDRALYRALQDQCGAGVRTSIRQTYPQLLKEPETSPTQWNFILSGYEHFLMVDENS